MPFIIITIAISVLFIYPLKLMVEKYGSRRIYFFCNFLFSFVFLIFMMYHPKGSVGIVVLVIVAILCGIGYAAGLLIPFHMMSNIVVIDKLLTGNKREGAFSAMFVVVQKSVIAITHAISGIILSSVGEFVREDNGEYAMEQPKEIKDAITGIITLGPFFAMVLSLFCIHWYPLDKEETDQNERLLKELEVGSEERQLIGVDEKDEVSKGSGFSESKNENGLLRYRGNLNEIENGANEAANGAVINEATTGNVIGNSMNKKEENGYY